MVRLPWRDRDGDESSPQEESGKGGSEYHIDADPIVTCSFQDGTLYVYEDQLFLERSGRSKFADKWIAVDQVRTVTYAKRLVISYLQIEQVDFENSDSGLISSPVDENTFHFGYGKRDCAKRARDEVLERLEETDRSDTVHTAVRD